MVKPWRNPQFHFLLIWSWGSMRCREVVGLPAAHPAAEHSGHYAEILAGKTGGSLPGSLMLREITVTENSGFQDWLQRVAGETPRAESVMLHLIFDQKPPSVIWALSGVFPVRQVVTSPGVRAHEVKIDQLMLAYDGVTVIRS